MARYTHSELEDLAFFRNQFYDQESGRWTQEDPIGFGGGFNLYAYVGNNPVSSVDPFGLHHCGLVEHGRLPTLPCPDPIELRPVVVEAPEPEDDPGGIGQRAVEECRKSIAGATFITAGDLLVWVRSTGRSPDAIARGVGRVISVGDKVSPVLAIIGAFTLAYNTTIDIQCRLGFLE